MTIEYTIEKIPLEKEFLDQPAQFPRLPQLYLEFLENKHKIKPELVNKEYAPPEITAEMAPAPAPIPVPTTPPAPAPAPIEDDDDDTASIKTTSTSKSRLLDILNKSKTPRPATPRIERKLPTLKELEQQNVFAREKFPLNADRLQDENEDKKRELLMKFDLLKKTYPRAQIPKVSIHEEYKSLERQYETTLYNLSVDNSVDNYKQYLTFGFMGIEWFCGKIFKMDMKGYADQQCTQMHIYEKFLVQIGQKNYLPTKKSWPVEVQLLFTVLIQTALFVMMRNLFKGAGAGIIKTVNEARFTGATSAPVKEPSPAPPKMRGPTINLNDL